MCLAIPAGSPKVTGVFRFIAEGTCGNMICRMCKGWDISLRKSLVKRWIVYRAIGKWSDNLIAIVIHHILIKADLENYCPLFGEDSLVTTWRAACISNKNVTT